MRKSGLMLLLALTLLLPFQPVQAKGLYIRDWIGVPVRVAPGDGAREIGQASSNDLVEVLRVRYGHCIFSVNRKPSPQMA